MTKQSYWIRVNLGEGQGQKKFSPERQIYEQGSDFVVALETARDCHSYASCLCSRDEPLPLAIKLKNEKYHLARYPGTGVKHKNDCRFFSLLNPEGGQCSYTKKALDETDNGILKIVLDFALQQRENQKDGIDEVYPPRPHRKSPPRDTMRLLAFAHLLWENSQLNLWHPGIKTARTSSLVGYFLYKAAKVIKAGNISLSDVLLTSAKPGSKDEKRNQVITLECQKLKRRQIVVSELAKWTNEREAGTDRLNIRDFAGMSYLKIDHARWKSALNRFPIELAAWRAGEKVMAIAVTDAPVSGTAKVRQIALMLVSERFIPCDSSYELRFEKRLAEQQRSFIKPLLYDASEMDYLPDFCLTDITGEGDFFPIEIWGMNDEDYLQHKKEKTEWYNKKYGHFGWLGWDVIADPDCKYCRTLPPAKGLNPYEV